MIILPRSYYWDLVEVGSKLAVSRVISLGI